MFNFVGLVIDRIYHKNKNWLCIICGETGSGKSYSALRLAEIIDKNFTVDNVVFSAEEFMRVLTSGRVKKGSVIVFDEAGVGLPAREWYSISNKMLNYVLQTFRRDNLAVIFTTPSFDFIDSQARKLFHTYIQTIRVDFEGKRVITKLHQIDYNPRFGKIYMRYYHTNPYGKKVHPFIIPKPSTKLIRAYERKKAKFTETLKEETMNEISNVKEVILIKKKAMTQELICEPCGYKWIPKKLNPKRCPRCNRFLDYSRMEKQKQ